MSVPGRVFLLLIILLTFISSHAQQTKAYADTSGYIFHNLDNTNGLTGNNVFSINQDAAGFIWIGTKRGLQRYDGIRFVDYPDVNPGVNGTLAASDLYTDTSSGRIFYNQDRNTIRMRSKGTRIAIDLAPDKVFDKNKAGKFKDDRGAPWYMQEWISNPSRVSPGIRSGTVIIRDPTTGTTYFGFMFHDVQQQRFWVYGTPAGMLAFDVKEARVDVPGISSRPNEMFALIAKYPTMVHRILLDSYGYLWVIGWAETLYRYDPRLNQLVTFSINDIVRQQGFRQPGANWVDAMIEDDHRNIWLSTAHAGLLRFHYDTGEFSYFTAKTGNSQSIQYNLEMHGLFQDREQNIWIGTDKGLSFFNPYHEGFTALRPRESSSQPEVSEISCGTITGNNRILVGSMGSGVNIYDTGQRFIKRILFNGENENRVWAICANTDGVTWVGCQAGILHLLDDQQRLIKTFTPPEAELYTIRSIIHDDAGNIYLGLNSGRVVKWDRASGTFQSFDNDLTPGHKAGPVLHMYLQGKTLWAACMNGLAAYDIGKFKRTGIYRPEGLPYTPCRGVTGLNDTILIAGFENAGLAFFNTKRKKFIIKNNSNGQPGISVHAVTIDKANELWYTTDFAVVRAEARTGSIINSYPARGVIGSPFQLPVFLFTTGGLMLTASSTEMIAFKPETINRQTVTTSALAITGMQVLGKTLFPDSLINADAPVRLKYDQNFITIGYANLQFGNLTADHYYYRMSGIDKQWVDAGTSGSAGYTNLAPGDYVFQVKSGNVRNPQVARIRIIIAPPFWATWWFRIICISVVAALAALLINWYIRNIRRKADLEQQIARSEMMALRAQMNPHFIFNCINSIDAMIQDGNKYDATMYLGKFAKLIRNILDSSTENTIPFNKDLETLRLYIDLERFRTGNNFEVFITADASLNGDDIKVPPLIIQPYVENAIQHGLRNLESGTPKLNIRISRENDKLVYVIEDNGVGRSASVTTGRKHRSYGLKMSGDRVRLFNREDQPVEITDLETDGKPAGTRVQVTLIIKHA